MNASPDTSAAPGKAQNTGAGRAAAPAPPDLVLYPVATPAGPGWIGLSGGKVVWLSIGDLDMDAVRRYWRGPCRQAKKCPLSQERLKSVALGRGDLPLAPEGTPFQQKVWNALQGIPCAATLTYSELAEQIGKPGAARAVGAAVGANPIAWLIPCHRVVPAGGGLGSYRWGTHSKDLLLQWEKRSRPVQSAHEAAEQRHKLEAMLIKAQRFEDIARLAGDIAHDLNNLLAPIRMATELLKRKLGDATLDRYVDIIETSTGRARSVIQDILSFSKETECATAAPVELLPLLQELEKIARETFPPRIQLHFDTGKRVPVVCMDPTQFHRAILNILVNARDAIAGDGSITVSSTFHDIEMQVCVGDRCLLPGRYACISVSDTGCGIPDDIRDHIFDPFFTTKPKEQGTGLGLASVYGIVARAGGFIDLESTVGTGSTFHVFLPLAR
jgi:O-6-methylguanine DNA methyltransferase